MPSADVMDALRAGVSARLHRPMERLRALLRRQRSRRAVDKDYALSFTAYTSYFGATDGGVDLQAKSIVQFPVVLPFQLPKPATEFVSVIFANSDAAVFHFEDVRYPYFASAGLGRPVVGKNRIARTRVEMSLLRRNATALPEDNDASLAFDVLLDALNDVIAAIGLATKDYRVRRVSKDMLEPMSVFRVIDPTRWSELFQGLFVIHLEVPYEASDLDLDRTHEVMRILRLIRDRANPFLVSEELHLAAVRNLRFGSYAEAVVAAQTNLEAFATILLTSLTIEQGTDVIEAKQRVAGTSFIRRIRDELPNLMSFSWSDRDGGKFSTWKSDTYDLRNRVVHEGYVPAGREAAAAVDGAVGCRTELLERLRNVQQRFPRTAEFVLPGDEG